jgi:hypothetical protein
VVQNSGDMHIEVGIDTSGDPEWHRGHGSSRSLASGWGDHIGRDDGQDSDGPRRQAPSRSLRPNRWVLGECRSQADGSLSRQLERASAKIVGSDLARAPTRTLTATTAEMVDPISAHVILAAGSESLRHVRREHE